MKRVIGWNDPDFASEKERICRRGTEETGAVTGLVSEIIDRLRREGDSALVDYTERFDRLKLTPQSLAVTGEELQAAWESITAKDRESLVLAAARIRSFHEKQLPKSWITEEPGVLLGQRITPLEAVGLYVPGGKAAYPSSVLMNCIPAKVAGVERIVMVTPTPYGETNPHVLAAAKLAGVDEVYRVGGAQAVAALAYGTETIAPVHKIVGPGNIYVATAKQLVFGAVDIDMIAGPSEILVVNDGTGEPAHVAADLLSQAEHDEMATTVLTTTSRAFGEAVAAEVKNQLATLSRRETAAKSWEERGAIFIAETLEQCCGFANEFASEHLELAVERPMETLNLIRHGGAIFLGHYTPEALGDYAAGPNHVLPTAGSARFFSPLGVEDFIKRSSLINYSAEALAAIGEPVAHLARLEGLEAHARAVDVRLGKKT